MPHPQERKKSFFNKRKDELGLMKDRIRSPPSIIKKEFPCMNSQSISPALPPYSIVAIPTPDSIAALMPSTNGNIGSFSNCG
jgi:hypothetical protein